MADKRRVRQTLHWIERIKTWQLVILLVLSLFITATFLRLNNIGMVQRREAVFAADKAADSDEIQLRLYDLQRYSASHMNANTGDIYLDKKYNRDVERLVSEAQADSTPSDILKKADDACKPRFSGYTQAYVQCVAAEQAKYPSSNNPSDTVSFPNPSLYKHSYSSPGWSPDFAGWSMVVSILFLLAIIARLIIRGVLQLLLHRHYRHA